MLLGEAHQLLALALALVMMLSLLMSSVAYFLGSVYAAAILVDLAAGVEELLLHSLVEPSLLMMSLRQHKMLELLLCP